MSTKKVKRNEAREKRQEKQAEKVVNGIFIGLIALAVIAIVCFSVWG